MCAVYKKDDSIKMSNSNLDVIITRGRLTSVYDKAEKWVSPGLIVDSKWLTGSQAGNSSRG